MLPDPAKYRTLFFTEASEYLASFESSLLRLEGDPDDREALAEAFRIAHSLKGGADTVQCPEIARFAHCVEEILEQLRNGDGPVPSRVVDLLMQAHDVLGGLLVAARTGEGTPPGTLELQARISQLAAESNDRGRKRERSTVVRVRFAPNAFRVGIDPLVVLREFGKLGRVEEVHQLLPLPSLSELDPEISHFAWEIRLRTNRDAADLANPIGFSSDAVCVEIIPEYVTSTPRSGSRSDSLIGAAVVDGASPIRFAVGLVRRGLLTAEDLVEALDRQHAQRPLLSQLAVRDGCTNVQGVVLSVRRTEPGGRFLDTAVRLGVLSEADAGRLMLLQSRLTPPLGEVLVNQGAISQHVLDAEVARCREALGGHSVVEESICEPGPVSIVPPATADMTVDFLADNAEILADFCMEADEHLEAADRHLLTIDAEPTNSEALNAVYRGYHTIKGGAGMLNLEAISSLAHEAENLLNIARDGKLLLHGTILDVVFTATDALKRQIGYLRGWITSKGKLEVDPQLPRIVAEIRQAADPSRPPPEKPKPAPADTRRATVPESLPTNHAAIAEKDTVRVDRDRLDKLINAIGELVIAQSMAQQVFDEMSVKAIGHAKELPEVGKITRDLQELSLSLRMVPLQGTFQKMARLVRDLSRKLDKPVDFHLHGEETELDKTVVDRLGDPLMHMVRNAVDHGLEPTAVRIAAGKPPAGRIELRAYHQGGSVYLELVDDGRGLNRETILRKAVEKGIVPDGQRLSDAEIYSLIFAPGFSTAAVVTDVSGRGVGMDVVRRNVEALQGSIHIRTVLGSGTTFTIRLPLTLAIMDGLMIGLGDQVFVVPILSVVESFRPRTTDLHRVAGWGEVVTVRSETVPLLRLSKLLGRPGRCTDPCRGLIVLVEDQGKKHAILVDELLGQIQAVVKSLDANYGRVEGLAGATILGDGRVAMILDIHGLARLHGRSGGGGRPIAVPELIGESA